MNFKILRFKFYQRLFIFYLFCLVVTSNAQDGVPTQNKSPAQQRENSIIPNNIIQFPINDPTISKSGFTCPVVGTYNDVKIYPSFFSQLGTFFPVIGLLFTVAVYGTTSVFGYITTCLLDDIVILGTSLVLIISWYNFTKPFWMYLLANLLQDALSNSDAVSTFFLVKQAIVINGSDSGPVGFDYTYYIIILGCVFVGSAVAALVTLGIIRYDFHKKRELLNKPDNKKHRRFYKRLKSIIVWAYFIHSLEILVYTVLQFVYVFKVLLKIQGSGDISLAEVLKAINLVTINYFMKFLYFISTTTLITSYYFPNLEIRLVEWIKGIFTSEHDVKLSDNERRFYQGFIRKKTFFLTTALSLGQIFFEYYWFCTPPVISTVFNTILTTVLTRAIASFFSNRGIVKYIYKKNFKNKPNEATKEHIQDEIQEIQEEDVEDKKKVYAEVSIMDIYNVKSFNINKDKYDGSSIINPGKLEKYFVDSTGGYVYVYKKNTKEVSPVENTIEKSSSSENISVKNDSVSDDEDEITPNIDKIEYTEQSPNIDKIKLTGPSPEATNTKKFKSRQYYYVMPVQESMYFVELEFDESEVEKVKKPYEDKKNKYNEAKKKYDDIMKKKNEEEKKEEIKKLDKITEKYDKIKSNYNQIKENEKKKKIEGKYKEIEDKYKEIKDKYMNLGEGDEKKGMKIEYEYKKSEYEYEKKKKEYKEKWKEYERVKKEYVKIKDECGEIEGNENVERMNEYNGRWKKYEDKKKKYEEIKDNEDVKKEYENAKKEYENAKKIKEDEMENAKKEYENAKKEYEKNEKKGMKIEYEKKKKEYKKKMGEYKKIKGDEMEKAMKKYEKVMKDYEKAMKDYENKMEKDKGVNKNEYDEKKKEYEYEKKKKEYNEKKRAYEEAMEEKEKAYEKAMKECKAKKKDRDKKREKQNQVNVTLTAENIRDAIQRVTKEYENANKKKNEEIKKEYAKALKTYMDIKSKKYLQQRQKIEDETTNKYQEAREKYINDKMDEIMKKYKDYNNNNPEEMEERDKIAIVELEKEKIEYDKKLEECEEAIKDLRKKMDGSSNYAELEKYYEQYVEITKKREEIEDKREEKTTTYEYEVKKREYKKIKGEKAGDNNEDSYCNSENIEEYMKAIKNYKDAHDKKKNEYQEAKAKYEKITGKIIQKYKEAKKEYDKEKKKVRKDKEERIKEIKEEIKEEIEIIRNRIGYDGIAFHDYTDGSFEKQNGTSRFQLNDLEKGLPPAPAKIRDCMKIEGHVLINILETGFLNYIIYSHRSSQQPGLLKWIKWKYNWYFNRPDCKQSWREEKMSLREKKFHEKLKKLGPVRKKKDLEDLLKLEFDKLEPKKQKLEKLEQEQDEIGIYLNI